MNPIKRPIIDEDKLGINPFIVNDFIKARSFDKNTQLIRQEDGINIPSGNYTEPILIEDQQYTKVFHDKDYRYRILNLPEKALKLYTFITFSLTRNQDYIWINNVLFQKEVGYRKKDYTEAIHYLIRYSIVTPTMYPDVFFINPFIFFCGDRLKKYPNNIKTR